MRNRASVIPFSPLFLGTAIIAWEREAAEPGGFHIVADDRMFWPVARVTPSRRTEEIGLCIQSAGVAARRALIPQGFGFPLLLSTMMNGRCIAPYPTVFWKGGRPKARKQVWIVVPCFWSCPFVPSEVVAITSEDVGCWPYSVGMLLVFVQFFGTLFWFGGFLQMVKYGFFASSLMDRKYLSKFPECNEK